MKNGAEEGRTKGTAGTLDLSRFTDSGAFDGVAKAAKKLIDAQQIKLASLPIYENISRDMTEAAETLVQNSGVSKGAVKLVADSGAFRGAAKSVQAMQPFQDVWKSLSVQIGRMSTELKEEERRLYEEFASVPEAHERFTRFFRTAEETKDGQGHHTYTALAELLDCTPKTASKYIRNSHAVPSGHGLLALKYTIGEKRYCDMIHGEGSYDQRKADEERIQLIDEMASVLQDMPMEQLRLFHKMIEGMDLRDS